MRRKTSNFRHSVTGDVVELYERQLGTTPEQVRDQEERVHERAGELAEKSSYSLESCGPKISGETVQVLSHDSEDREQDQIRYRAANSIFRRTS